MSADPSWPVLVLGPGRCWVHCPTAPEAVAAVQAILDDETTATLRTVTSVQFAPRRDTGEPGWIVTVQPAPKEDER